VFNTWKKSKCSAGERTSATDSQEKEEYPRKNKMKED
jgi:hypothetical protein